MNLKTSLVPFAIGALAFAQPPGQKTFPSPGAAAEALHQAAKANDMEATDQILGPDSKDVLYTGDDVADKTARAFYVSRYDQMHRLVVEPDQSVVVYIGAENWPFPIPIVQKNGVWYYDTKSGKDEILYRRIGRNEFTAIDTCRALVDAQREYYAQNGGQYAQKFVSDPGQHNGLYWKPAPGEPDSPVGPRLADAAAEGYNFKSGTPQPYRGYIFHMLTAQGKSSAKGAHSFVVDGKMTRGFAFVAYPAKYRVSGVMTFLVGPDGTIYQKDLGADTTGSAVAMKSFNPDKTWQRVVD
jgi:Protein of unknown function (DUF2950)